MLDVQFISTLLIFIRSGIEEETTQTALNRAYDQYNDSYPEAEIDREVLKDSINIIDKLIGANTSTSKIVQKKTHFYTLFVYGYYLLQKTIDSKQLSMVAEKLDIWYKLYLEDSEFNNKVSDKLLSEYRILSQEGVQKKANRLRRFELIKEYVGL